MQEILYFRFQVSFSPKYHALVWMCFEIALLRKGQGPLQTEQINVSLNFFFFPIQFPRTVQKKWLWDFKYYNWLYLSGISMHTSATNVLPSLCQQLLAQMLIEALWNWLAPWRWLLWPYLDGLSCSFMKKYHSKQITVLICEPHAFCPHVPE